MGAVRRRKEGKKFEMNVSFQASQHLLNIKLACPDLHKILETRTNTQMEIQRQEPPFNSSARQNKSRSVPAMQDKYRNF